MADNRILLESGEKMIYYAQLNENYICIGISCLSSKVESEKMIAISSNDTSPLGKKYVDGEFIESEVSGANHDGNALTENEIIMLALADLYVEVQSLKEGLK